MYDMVPFLIFEKDKVFNAYHAVNTFTGYAFDKKPFKFKDAQPKPHKMFTPLS